MGTARDEQDAETDTCVRVRGGVLCEARCAVRSAARAAAVLPNGLKITQWDDFETKFLYKEIFVDDTYAPRIVALRRGRLS